MTSYEKLSKVSLNSSGKQTNFLQKMVILGTNPTPSANSCGGLLVPSCFWGTVSPVKAKLTTSNRKPVEIKRGNVTVKIYAGRNRVPDKVYPQFTLVYYDGSQRKKLRFADISDAKREAELVATKLANGENEVLRLTSTDRAIYMQAVAHLRPLGIPLNVAVLEYISAVKSLPEGTTLKQAVDLIRRHDPASFEKRTVRQVADEMLAAKRAANLSDAYAEIIGRTIRASKRSSQDFRNGRAWLLSSNKTSFSSPLTLATFSLPAVNRIFQVNPIHAFSSGMARTSAAGAGFSFVNSQRGLVSIVSPLFIGNGHVSSVSARSEFIRD
jgi:hypothetical protein